jgi:ABC-type sugar transport system ATPase subunit
LHSVSRAVAESDGVVFVSPLLLSSDTDRLLALYILENVMMAIFDKVSSFGVIRRRIEKDETSKSIADLSVKCASPAQRVRALSGGNQQKVVLGKWLATTPSILIMDEPTRGIDVGSKSQIYDIIHALADAGKGIILISSELPEVLELSDRIIVFAAGATIAELDPARTTQDEILSSCDRAESGRMSVVSPSGSLA